MKKRISIALATFNGARYLPQQLESYLKQERLPDELIVSDDCSADNTPSIVERFAASAPFPVILQRNDRTLGPVENCALSLSRCSGEIVCLSDQDDIWLPSHIRCLCAEFNRDVVAVCSNSVQIDSDGHDTNVDTWRDCAGLCPHMFVEPADALRLLLGYRGVSNAHGLALLRRVLDVALPLQNGSGPGFPYASLDTYMVFVSALLGRVAFIVEPMTLYRRHSTNTSSLEPRPVGNRLSANFRGSSRYDHRLEQLLEALNVVSERAREAISSDVATRAAQLLCHYSTASAARQKGLTGLLTVARLLINGSYHRNGRGLRQSIADALCVLGKAPQAGLPPEAAVRQRSHRLALQKLKELG